MIIHPEGQARVALGLPSVGPSRAAGERGRTIFPPSRRQAAARRRHFAGVAAGFVVLATDRSSAASAMAIRYRIQPFSRWCGARRSRPRHRGMFVRSERYCRAARLGRARRRRARKRRLRFWTLRPGEEARRKVQLVSRILVAFYFLFSGGFLCPSSRRMTRWRRGGNAVDRLRRRLRLHVGFRRRHRRRGGGVGIQVHGRGGSSCRGPRRHARRRQARWTQAPPRRLHVRWARRTSVLAALLLLAATGQEVIRRRQVREGGRLKVSPTLCRELGGLLPRRHAPGAAERGR